MLPLWTILHWPRMGSNKEGGNEVIPQCALGPRVKKANMDTMIKGVGRWGKTYLIPQVPFTLGTLLAQTEFLSMPHHLFNVFHPITTWQVAPSFNSRMLSFCSESYYNGAWKHHDLPMHGLSRLEALFIYISISVHPIEEWEGSNNWHLRSFMKMPPSRS